MPEIEPRLITDQVLARLDTLTGVKVYDTEIPADDKPPLRGDGRVAPYIVAYPFGPNPVAETDLAFGGIDLTYQIQLRLVAGHRPDTENLLYRVLPLFRGWTPTLTGVCFGLFRPPPGYQSGPIQPDRDISPPRYWLPLQYRTTATN